MARRRKNTWLLFVEKDMLMKVVRLVVENKIPISSIRAVLDSEFPYRFVEWAVRIRSARPEETIEELLKEMQKDHQIKSFGKIEK